MEKRTFGSQAKKRLHLHNFSTQKGRFSRELFEISLFLIWKLSLLPYLYFYFDINFDNL